MYAIDAAMSVNVTWICPPSRSVIAGPALRYGTCVRLTPVIILKVLRSQGGQRALADDRPVVKEETADWDGLSVRIIRRRWTYWPSTANLRNVAYFWPILRAS